MADAIRNLAKCDDKSIDYRHSYAMIEAPASKDLILFPYDSDTYQNFQESYQELEQLHHILDFSEITMTVQVFLLSPKVSAIFVVSTFQRSTVQAAYFSKNFLHRASWFGKEETQNAETPQQKPKFVECKFERRFKV